MGTLAAVTENLLRLLPPAMSQLSADLHREITDWHHPMSWLATKPQKTTSGPEFSHVAQVRLIS
jgi:hypothetical protein